MLSLGKSGKAVLVGDSACAGSWGGFLWSGLIGTEREK